MKKSHCSEILDGRAYSREELFQNLKELRLVNQFLGGHANSASLMRDCLRYGFLPDTVVDIGCGGGDTLQMLHGKFSNVLPGAAWLGCDLNEWCLEYAGKHHHESGIHFLLDDFQNVKAEGKVLFHAALFFHHFREDEIVRFLSFVKENGSAIIINDLHRHSLAWLSIKLISRLPGIGRLFRNDAPLSVRRSFTRQEWVNMLEKCGIQDYRIRWAWAFRYLIFIPPQHENH